MNELQQARADWIAAQEKILKLEKENSDIRQKLFAAEMNLNVLRAQRDIAQALNGSLLRGLITS